MAKAFGRRIALSVIRGGCVAVVLVVFLATFGIAVTHLTSGQDSDPASTSRT